MARGSVDNFMLVMRAIKWNFVNMHRTIDKRNKIQKFRKVSDKEIFSKVSKPVDFFKFFNDFKRVEKDLT